MSWWRGEGDRQDAIGTNHVTSGASGNYTTGIVNAAFAFTGSASILSAPSTSSLNPGSALTMEGWIYANAHNPSDSEVVFGKDDPYGARQYFLAVTRMTGAWLPRAHVGLGGGLAVLDGKTVIQTGAWYHVAMTYDGAALKLYVNGSLDGSLAASGQIISSQVPFKIGGEGGGPWNFNGKVDELALYGRALSATELQAIYQAGSSGKCFTGTPPLITSQPTNQMALAGTSAQFAVTATGTSPLSYQWTFEADPLAGATNTVLTIPAVTSYQTGQYAVVVSNPYGSLTSSVAVLSILPGAPPLITLQPTNQAVIAGTAARFTVAATGTAPMRYQWTFEGANLAGATNTSLLLPAVSDSLTGNYAVVVTNFYGAATSSIAVLSIIPPPPCLPPFPGLVGWWRAAGDASDAVSGSDGTLQGGASYAPGMVGQAFSFSGASQGVLITNASAWGVTAQMTVECWVYVSGSATGYPTIVCRDNASTSRQYLLNVGTVGSRRAFRAHVWTSAGLAFAEGATAIVQDTWYHVAMTYDGSLLRLFVNGGLDASQPVTGALLASSEPLRIGLNGGGYPFTGRIDEVSLYSRPLTTNEVQAIVAAGVSGKCATPVPPSFLAQPASQSVAVGGTASFGASAGGTRPLSYQWARDGVALDGATNVSLTITNAQKAHAGNYAVTVTNLAGSATSSNAVLTVSYPPATLQVGSTNGIGGAIVTVPVWLAANGDENALGFSLVFDSTKLAFAGIEPDPALADASVFINTNLVGSGKLGLSFAVAPGTNLPAGIQQLALVTFASTVRTTPSTTQVSFGDQPTVRQLADVFGRNLGLNYAAGTVALASSVFEGDTSPRPDGDKALTVSDWVLLGRYAARLDYPTNASEFQRADCAPRTTLGDGSIKVTDWVQAGRYASALDPLTVVGGPSAEVTPNPGPLREPKDPSDRRLEVSNVSLFGGQTGVVAVVMQAQGDESGMGFSLAFNPALFTYVGAVKGTSSSSATLNVNASQAAAGKLGVALALSSGTYAVGAREVIKVTLSAKPSASAGPSVVTFADLPVPREISDARALPLPAQFLSGTLTIQPPPVLRIAWEGANVLLAWPASATNFTLRAAPNLGSTTWTNAGVLPTVINGENNVTLPPASGTLFYRLGLP